MPEIRYRDPDRSLAGVRLVQRAGVTDTEFRRAGPDWYLDVVCERFLRLEYQLELRHPDGRVEVVGEKSVLECPGYVPPSWLDRRPVRTGRWRRLHPSVRVWSPDEATDRVLVAHDGTDYQRYGALAAYSASGLTPAHHLALLDPVDRTEAYSANPVYARWLRTLLRRLPGRRVVGMGASLGALAMLQAEMSAPGAFTGLFLQSGSFFRPRYDRHESDFPRYRRIIRFTARVNRGLAAGRPARPGLAVPTVLTCGLAEENLHNNRDMAVSLRRLGYPTTLVEVPDAHNFTGWRDALDPGLTDLLRRVWES